MGKKPKLLILEDDEWSQKIYKHLFSKEYNIVICKNDETFYSALNNDQFDIFLIDLALGKGRDGIQLIRELRQMELYATVPIIVVTAHALRKDEQIALEAGATKFLRKPIENQILLETFKEYL